MRFRFPAGVAGAALLAALLVPGPAQAQYTRGIVSGTAFDQTGAALPGAAVTVVNEETGIKRSSVTNEKGAYRVPALEPGRYSVLIEMPGFTKTAKKGIEIPAAEVTVNFDLKVQTVGEELTVTAEATAIALNKTNATVGIVLKGRQAVELPLSAARNIDNLALLAPNTFSAPGSTGISANGSRARNNNFMIDGTDNNDISVTLRTTPVVPEAVAEFQNLTNAYNAEFGRNSGAQINVITKSGTNSFHGEAWDYYRTSGLNALDNLEKAAGLLKSPKSVRHQLGAYLSGPVIKDKTFFFALFQRDTIRTGDILPTTATRMITPRGYAALASVPLRNGQSATSRQAVLEKLRFLEQVYAGSPNFTSLSNVLVNGVPIETGLASIGSPQPFTSPFAMGRLDHQLTQNDSLTVRYLHNSPLTDNFVSNCAFGTAFCGQQDVTERNASLSHTHVFSGNALNELRVAFIKRDLAFPENDPTTPTGTIGGLFTVGGLANFPQGRSQKSWQFSDVMSLTNGRHTFKFGADIRRVILDNQAAFDSKGTFNFANLEAYLNNVATTFQQALQTSSFVAKQWQTFVFVQDDFRLSPDLVLNLGLRYEISSAPLGFFGAEDPQVRAALVPGPVKRDTNNWSPVVGFAWSPREPGFFGNGRSVFRGGYRTNYDVLFYNILTVNASNYPRVVVPILNNVVDVYPNVVPLSGTATFNPLAGFVNSPEDLQNPKQHIYSLSMQRELGRDFVVELGYTGSTGRNGINQLQANYAVLTPAQAATVQSTSNSLSIPNVQARRLFPQFGSRTLIASTAKSQYHAGYFSVNKRMSHGLQFQANYTMSRFKSDNDESLGVADITNSSPQIPQDYANLDVEYSLSVFDRPHRFVVNYLWEIPGPKSGALKQILGGWQFSGITQTQSGQPFTIVTGIDTNGNGGGGDRPNLDPSGTFTWDENHRGFTNNGLYVVPRGTNGLPLLFSLGNGNGPRNDQRGPGYWRTDLGLIKRFEVGRHRVTTRVDALNVFNQDEYGNPVANMNSPSFGTNVRNWGNRSLTFGLKYGF